MNNRKYKTYIKEICSIHSFSESEVTSLFCTAIARAYDAIGSAYIWEDGTITVAKDNRGRSIYLQDFIISAKQYDRIIKFFMKLINELSAKRRILNFTRNVLNEVTLMRVIRKDEHSYILKPILEVGDVSGYSFVLSKNKTFYKEKLFVDDEIFVICKGFKKAQKTVSVVRFDKEICELEFSRIFHNMLTVTEEDYLYKNVHFQMDHKNRKVTVFIKWKKKPSSFFIAELNNRLEDKFGRWKIPLKIENKTKE